MTPRVGTMRRAAAVLLEVVIALAILVAAMGLLGAQLAGGLEMTSYSEEQLRATLLADHLAAMVRLDPRLAVLMSESETLEYECTDETPLGYALAPLPGTFWRIVHEPVDREDEQKLRRVVIEILREPSRDRFHSRDGSAVIRQLVMFKAAPPRVDLVTEAGLSEQQAELLRMAVPIAGFDPRAVDFQQLMTMLDEGTLAQLMPLLGPLIQQLGGGGLPAPFAGPTGLEGMEELLGGLEGMAGPGISAEELAATIRQAIEGSGGMRPPAAVAPPAPVRPVPGRRGGAGPPPMMEEPFEPPPRPVPPPAIDIGRGSGPGGEYTIEDLMRLRDAYERQQQGGL